MAKKIKKNKFSISNPGAKQTKKVEEMKQLELDARANMLAELTVLVAWVLRANHGYGKKRIVDFIGEIYELKSDTEMYRYGQELIPLGAIPDQLKEEIGLDVLGLIDELAGKHIERVKGMKNERKNLE